VPHDVACVGPASVDVIIDGLEALPVHGELAHAARSEIAPGGACNVAIACSRLGLRARFVAPGASNRSRPVWRGPESTWIGPPGLRTPLGRAREHG
jgi:hypothetical protein